MEVSGDDLAGVVDLFDGLTRSELERALEELAFKRGEDVAGDTFGDDIDVALEQYHLVVVDDVRAVGDSNDAGGDKDAGGDGGGDIDAPLLVAGPVAFPALPEGAADLPHIMDVPDRSVDRETAAAAARDRLAADADGAIEREDDERAAELLDVSYDLETWAAVDVGHVRNRLEDVGDR
jgi:hypothetical protein